MRRFDPEYAPMGALLDSGTFGRTLLLHNTNRNKAVPDSFRSELIVRDSLVHEVDVAWFMFGEEITEVTVPSPTPTSAAAERVVDPQVSIFRTGGGALVTEEVFVKNQVGHEVRREAGHPRRAADQHDSGYIDSLDWCCAVRVERHAARRVPTPNDLPEAPSRLLPAAMH